MTKRRRNPCCWQAARCILINSAEFDPSSGVVFVDSTQSSPCTVQVRFLTDDSAKKEIVYAEALAAKGEKVVTALEMNTAALPEYYAIEVKLCSSLYNVAPYATHVIAEYTKQMQEIYAAKVDDFDPAYVINFDNSTDTNFMVLNDETVIAESSETANVLVSADYDNGIYVFENADERVMSLKKDDCFYIQPTEEDMIAISVDSVQTEDGVTTITESDTKAEDVFDFIKIEANYDADDAVMDMSDADEGVRMLDSLEVQDKAGSLVGLSGEGSISHGTKWFELEELGLSASITPSLDFSFYKSFKYVSVEVSLNLPFTFDLGFEGKIEKDVEIGNVTFRFVRFSNLIWMCSRV